MLLIEQAEALEQHLPITEALEAHKHIEVLHQEQALPEVEHQRIEHTVLLHQEVLVAEVVLQLEAQEAPIEVLVAALGVLLEATEAQEVALEVLAAALEAAVLHLDLAVDDNNIKLQTS